MHILYDVEVEEQTKRTTKKCPFCAETIQYHAIKCRYCNEFLDGRQAAVEPPQLPVEKPKALHSNRALILALLTVGPFAIPLIWTNPRYNNTVKALLTVGILGVTAGLAWAAYHTITKTLNEVQALGIAF